MSKFEAIPIDTISIGKFLINSMSEKKNMKKEKFLKGSPLFALARSKARGLGIDPKKLNLEQLIHEVQQKEGHEGCFRKKSSCPELGCCWQLSCKAKMVKE